MRSLSQMFAKLFLRRSSVPFASSAECGHQCPFDAQCEPVAAAAASVSPTRPSALILNPSSFRLHPFAIVPVIATALLTWMIASSLSIYPHSISYFNEIIGGPKHGGEHLLDSNIAWDQDLIYLNSWVNSLPRPRHFYCVERGALRLRRLSGTIEIAPLEWMLDSSAVPPGTTPGWFIADLNDIFSHPKSISTSNDRTSREPSNNLVRIGYSIYAVKIPALDD